eukprot:10239921-Alexandrium_andersonii.AAC.1
MPRRPRRPRGALSTRRSRRGATIRIALGSSRLAGVAASMVHLRRLRTPLRRLWVQAEAPPPPLLLRPQSMLQLR